MKKVIERLCEIEGDKWVHLVVCLLLTFVVGQGVHWFSEMELAECAGIGATAAMTAGFFKEWIDEFRGGEMDYMDLVADFIGCMIGLTVTAI